MQYEHSINNTSIYIYLAVALMKMTSADAKLSYCTDQAHGGLCDPGQIKFVHH